MKDIHLVALTDGTDEIFNLGYYNLEFKEGKPAADSFRGMLLDDFKENWSDDDFDRGIAGYLEWQEGRFWLPSFVYPGEMVDLQNHPDCNKHVFNEGSGFMPLEHLILVLDALRKVILPA